MTPFDHLRLWFDGLDEDLQHAIGFALVPVLVDDLRAQRTRPERDFTKALEAPLTPSRFTPRAIGKVVSATAFVDYAFGEALSMDGTVRCIGSQPAQDKHLDHIEKALTSSLVATSRSPRVRCASQSRQWTGSSVPRSVWDWTRNCPG